MSHFISLSTSPVHRLLRSPTSLPLSFLSAQFKLGGSTIIISDIVADFTRLLLCKVCSLLLYSLFRSTSCYSTFLVGANCYKFVVIVICIFNIRQFNFVFKVALKFICFVL
jgi:hypothetical protein